MAKPLQATKLAIAPAPAAESAPVKRGPGRPPGAKNVAAATPSAPKARKGKPTQWSKWGKQALRFIAMLNKLEEIGKIPGTSLNTIGVVESETLDDLANLASQLQKLDADKVEVPAIPKPPKAPMFVVGDEVSVVGKFRGKYVETGLYSVTDLTNLVVVAIGKKGILCEVAAADRALQVFIRYTKHLEKR